MRVLCLQHEEFEGPAGVADWVAERRHELAVHRVYRGGVLPDHSTFDRLLIMGGTMNVDEHTRHPWLRSEISFIRQACEAGKTVVGICLGGQLIARSLGATVRPNEFKEIGWFPVELTLEGAASNVFGFLPARFTTFHWHGDTFELPAGSIRLAQSEGCANQAFLCGDRILGLQFHPEATEQNLRDLATGCAHELKPGRYVQTADEIHALAEQHLTVNRAALFGMLDRLPG